MTQYYLGVKQILAWPSDRDGEPGYAVRYNDGYTSWSPKGVFEQAYLPMGLTNDGTTITPEMVEGFIAQTDIDDSASCEKLTVVIANLVNGFLLTESSDCADSAMALECCNKGFKGAVSQLLGFVLQWAQAGLTPRAHQAITDAL